MDGKSLDVRKENINRMKSLFPEAVTEDKIDWEQIKATLGEDIEFRDERYHLNWAGKSEAFRVLQQQTTATLKAARDESVDFDTTQNLFIEGENLEVLKVLQKAYFGKIKMIYIDPPYNTGNDFVYSDKFAESREDYLKRSGTKDEKGMLQREGLFRNSKDGGHYHSNWLSMMYPRLYLARNPLQEDGVIFVSIDDNEVHNLRVLMNEVFGEENFVAQITLLCNPKGRSQEKHFATNHEYLIVFSREILDKGSFNVKKDKQQIEIEYTEEDSGGKFRPLELRNTHREFGKHNRKNLYYPLYVNVNSGDVKLDYFTGSVEPKFPLKIN